MYNRLKQIRDYKKMNQAEFAKLLGMGQSTLGMMEVGKREILDRHIKTICSICNVNEEWLRTGDGEMFKEMDDIDQLAAEFGLDEFAIRTLKALQQLTPANRETIMRVIVAVCKEYGVDTSELEAKSDIEPPKMDISIQEQADLLRARADSLEKGHAESMTTEKQA